MDPNLEKVISLHQKEYGTSPLVVASAPGKVNLLGDYTEYTQGLVCMAALEERVYVALSPRTDTLIRFYSREYAERKKATLSNLKFRKEDRWANYPKGIYAHFAQLGFEAVGMDLSILGNVPQGIGLGASQALTLATALALNHWFRAGFSTNQLIQAAHKTEIVFMGLSPGTAAFLVEGLARRDKLFFLDTRSLDHQHLDFNNPGRLAVINSRVPATSFDSSARRSREACDQCVKVLNDGKPGKTLRDFSKSDLRDSVGFVPESARRRCLHIIDENIRVSEAKEVLLAGDFGSLGKLMNRSHESLRDQFEVSCPEIDWLVKRLQETEGVIGARMTGEETGGSVVAFIQKEALKKFQPHLDEYERIFGFRAEILFSRPSDGALVHDLS